MLLPHLGHEFKSCHKNWAFVFAPIHPLKLNNYICCKLCVLSLEEFYLPLSHKMQWLAMLQILEGQAFFEMPECTSSAPSQTLIFKSTDGICILSQLTNGDHDSFVYSLHWGLLWVEISTQAYEANFFPDQKGQWHTLPI